MLQVQVNLRSRLMVLDISELGQRSGLPASAIRYYEEMGLIASVGRSGLRRLFEASALERLALISLAREAGFSLKEIAGMFAPDGKVRIDRKLLADKAVELNRRIRTLSRMRDGLRHAAVCPATSHMECPTFRRLLKLSAAKVRRSRGSRKK